MKYIIAILLFTLFSCNQISNAWQTISGDEDTKNLNIQDSIIEQIISPLFITNVDQLRLRRYPDTKSEILTTLDENSILIYLNEQTDYKDHIGKHSAVWIKVTTQMDEIVGWVYGANFFVEELLNESQIDSIHKLNKEIQVFEHKARRDMNELTGANWGNTVPGTRFSGYYTYDNASLKKIPHGKVIIRARIFDMDNKEVKFISCKLDMDNGMPLSDVTCLN